MGTLACCWWVYKLPWKMIWQYLSKLQKLPPLCPDIHFQEIIYKDTCMYAKWRIPRLFKVTLFTVGSVHHQELDKRKMHTQWHTSLTQLMRKLFTCVGEVVSEKGRLQYRCVLSFHLGIKRDETLSSHFHVTLMEHFLEGYTPNPASLLGSGRTMWAVELQQSWEDFIHMYR